MIAKVKSAAAVGAEGIEINIETDISKGLPYFNIIGLAAMSVKESAERVRRAVINSGYDYPKGRITVNLSPAYIHKRGSHYDLGIGIGLLAAMGKIKADLAERLFIGELSFDGKVSEFKGALAMLLSIVERGKVKEIILPRKNCSEVFLVTKYTDIKLIPVENLRQTVEHLEGNLIEPYSEDDIIEEQIVNNFDEVKGHDEIKSAIVTAVAGHHNLLMIGPPGTGKTMIAERIPGILPPMSLGEQIETTKIYSYGGKLTEERPVIRTRPFRRINCSITRAALIGGGNIPMPGEISLAHNGVLFADEMLDMPREVFELLREPLEEKRINIVRAGGSATFLSDFILIGAANPCKCGYLGDKERQCTCSAADIDEYRSRLNGPVADRIDMCVEVSRVDYKTLKGDCVMSGEQMAEKVLRLRDIAKKRGVANGMMSQEQIEEYCLLSASSERFIEAAYRKYSMSPRRYYKILKVARTEADLQESSDIKTEHLATALHYTRLLGGMSG